MKALKGVQEPYLFVTGCHNSGCNTLHGSFNWYNK